MAAAVTSGVKNPMELQEGQLADTKKRIERLCALPADEEIARQIDSETKTFQEQSDRLSRLRAVFEWKPSDPFPPASASASTSTVKLDELLQHLKEDRVVKVTSIPVVTAEEKALKAASERTSLMASKTSEVVATELAWNLAHTPYSTTEVVILLCLYMGDCARAIGIALTALPCDDQIRTFNLFMYKQYEKLREGGKTEAMFLAAVGPLYPPELCEHQPTLSVRNGVIFDDASYRLTTRSHPSGAGQESVNAKIAKFYKKLPAGAGPFYPMPVQTAPDGTPFVDATVISDNAEQTHQEIAVIRQQVAAIQRSLPASSRNIRDRNQPRDDRHSGQHEYRGNNRGSGQGGRGGRGGRGRGQDYYPRGRGYDEHDADAAPPDPKQQQPQVFQQ